MPWLPKLVHNPTNHCLAHKIWTTPLTGHKDAESRYKCTVWYQLHFTLLSLGFIENSRHKIWFLYMAQKWIWLDLIALQWDWSVISKWSQSQTSDSNIPSPRCFIASLSHGFHLQTMEFRTNPMEFRANPSRIPIKFRGGQSLMRWRARFGQSIAISWISCFSIVLCLSFKCATSVCNHLTHLFTQVSDTTDSV